MEVSSHASHSEALLQQSHLLQAKCYWKDCRQPVCDSSAAILYALVLLCSDQRITQDVERFCNDLATQILPKLILWPFIVGYYTYKTYNTWVCLVHQTLPVKFTAPPVNRMGFIGIVAIYGLFAVATVINKFLMGPVVALIVTQEKREGDFR